MATTETTRQIQLELGQLFNQWLRISSPLQHLHLIREKISMRGYQSFDSQDIMDELGRLQHLLGELNRDMLAVYDLINR